MKAIEHTFGGMPLDILLYKVIVTTRIHSHRLACSKVKQVLEPSYQPFLMKNKKASYGNRR